MSKLSEINKSIRNLEARLLEVENEEVEKEIYLQLYNLYNEQNYLLNCKKQNRYDKKKQYKEKLKANYGVNYWIVEKESETGELYYMKAYNSGGREVAKKLTSKKARKTGLSIANKGNNYRRIVPYSWYVY